MRFDSKQKVYAAVIGTTGLTDDDLAKINPTSRGIGAVIFNAIHGDEFAGGFRNLIARPGQGRCDQNGCEPT